MPEDEENLKVKKICPAKTQACPSQELSISLRSSLVSQVFRR